MDDRLNQTLDDLEEQVPAFIALIVAQDGSIVERAKEPHLALSYIGVKAGSLDISHRLSIHHQSCR